MLSYFRSKAHLLQAIPDLAVITSSEVNNMLQEGSVYNPDVTVLLAQVGNAEKGHEEASSKDNVDGKLYYGAKTTDISNLHVDEDSATAAVSMHHMSAADADAKSARNITCDAISGLLLQYITYNTTISNKSGVSSKAVGSPFGTLLNTTRSILQPMVSNSENLYDVLVLLAGLNIVRKVFYEAQVRHEHYNLPVTKLLHQEIVVLASVHFLYSGTFNHIHFYIFAGALPGVHLPNR